MKILVINAGSSSLKYQLINMDTKEMPKETFPAVSKDASVSEEALC